MRLEFIAIVYHPLCRFDITNAQYSICRSVASTIFAHPAMVKDLPASWVCNRSVRSLLLSEEIKCFLSFHFVLVYGLRRGFC